MAEIDPDLVSGNETSLYSNEIYPTLDMVSLEVLTDNVTTIDSVETTTLPQRHLDKRDIIYNLN